MITRLHDYLHLILAAIAILAMLAMLVMPAFAHETGHAVEDGHAVHATKIVGPADGWAFSLPEPGSYALPTLGLANDVPVRDETGSVHRLAKLYEERLTVLAFVFTRCADICPLATQRLAELRDLAAGDPLLSKSLQLLSLSFDPEHDTPARMSEFAEIWRNPDPAAATWRFLTPARDAVPAMLDAYDQHVIRRDDPDQGARAFSHILRVYLIDGDGRIRNVYSLDFLDPRLVLADIRTLWMSSR